MICIPAELCSSLNTNSRAPISAKHSDQTAVLRGTCYLKSSGSGGIESWLPCLLHCELLLVTEMTLQRETQMRDGLEERINSFPPTSQMTGLLQCSYIPYYAKLFHNTKYYSNTMCDYYNFPSLVHRYYICKHLLICCLWYSVLDRIFLRCSRSLQNFLLLYSSHQCSRSACVCWGNSNPDWAALSLLGKTVLDVLLKEFWMYYWFRRIHDTKALLSKCTKHIWNVWHLELIQLESDFKQKMVNLLFLRYFERE